MPAPKRLLILGGTPSHPGGVEAFCERATQALERRDAGWRIERLPTGTAYLGWSGVPRLVRRLAHVAMYRRHAPECVWLQYVNLPDLLYLLVARAVGMRVMVTPHLGSNWRSQSIPALRALSGWALRFADRLALISWTQESEINLGSRPPRSLIRNFLPEDLLTASPPPAARPDRPLQLIHSGRLSEGKGSFAVVEVCARLGDAGVPFHARITGAADPATYRRLDDLIAEHGLGDRVEVLGRVPDDALLGLLRGSDVLIHLSRIDSYPLITLEAMACGALPVAMELAGVRDQVETYGGAVVAAAAPAAEAAAWIAAQEPAALRIAGARAAARVRADYAWARCAEALEAALAACIRRDRVAVTEPEPAPR